MQISRFSKLTVAVFAAGILSVSSIAAQDMFSSMGLNSVKSPEMPTVQAPTIGGNFYTPGLPENFQSKKQQSAVTKKTEETADNSTKAQSQKATSLDTFSSLTASDLSSLSSLGLLDSLTNITGSNSSLSSIYNNSTSDAETKILLQRILSEIETIKVSNQQQEVSKQSQENSAVTVQEQLRSTTKNQANVSNDIKTSKVLRFAVNGYNILKTCTKIYISDLQPDGTFLVTGDRKYISDGNNRTETFHILFKTAPNENGSSNYSAAAAVTQDYKNEYSFLYQLANKENLSASRIGNLVTMRTMDPVWQLDLLIDLGKN